jgi:hypothetical protein
MDPPPCRRSRTAEPCRLLSFERLGGDIMNLMERVKGVAETAMDVSNAGFAKANELLDEYKAALDLLGRFGFTVSRFQFDVGIIPEIRTSITGSVADLQADQLKQMAEEHATQRLTVSILNALGNAKRFYDRLQLPSAAVTADVKLGLPPSISLRFE